MNAERESSAFPDGGDAIDRKSPVDSASARSAAPAEHLGQFAVSAVRAFGYLLVLGMLAMLASAFVVAVVMGISDA